MLFTSHAQQASAGDSAARAGSLTADLWLSADRARCRLSAVGNGCHVLCGRDCKHLLAAEHLVLAVKR